MNGRLKCSFLRKHNQKLIRVQIYSCYLSDSKKYLKLEIQIKIFPEYECLQVSEA